MTNIVELRRLAEAAASGPWWTSDKLKCHPDLELSDDTAYIAAASPDVVRGLLDEIEGLSLATKVAEYYAHEWAEERDQLRAVAVRLKGALMAFECRIEDGRETETLTRKTLGDPEVEKL